MPAIVTPQPDPVPENDPVDTDDLSAIIEPLLKTVQSEVIAYLTENLTPLTERLTSLEGLVNKSTTNDTTEQVEAPSSPDNATVAARLAELERREREANEAKAKAEAERAKQESLGKLRSEVESVLNGVDNLLHKDFLTNALYRELLETSEDVNGSWLTKDGKSASEYVSNYIQSDVGKHFIGVTVPQGTGTPPVTGRHSAKTQTPLKVQLTEVKW